LICLGRRRSGQITDVERHDAAKQRKRGRARDSSSQGQQHYSEDSAGFIKQGIKQKIEQYLPGEKKP
jgi:hypothetical protein